MKYLPLNLLNQTLYSHQSLFSLLLFSWHFWLGFTYGIIFNKAHPNPLPQTSHHPRVLNSSYKTADRVFVIIRIASWSDFYRFPKSYGAWDITLTQQLPLNLLCQLLWCHQSLFSPLLIIFLTLSLGKDCSSSSNIFCRWSFTTSTPNVTSHATYAKMQFFVAFEVSRCGAVNFQGL